MTEQEKFYNELYINTGTSIPVLMFFVLLIGLWKFKLLNRQLIVFLLFVTAMLLYNLLEQAFVWSVNKYTDWWLPYLKRYNIGDTNFLNIISREVDYLFLGWFYGKVFGGVFSKWIRIASLALFLVAIVVYFWVDGFRTYGNVNSTLNRLYLVALPILHLWTINRSAPTINLRRNSYFLISIGLLLPNLFGLFLSFIGDKINQTDFVLFVQVSLFRNALSAIGLFLFAYAFCQARYVRFLSKASTAAG